MSLCAIGFEIALTRYFAIANWSEYGYWIISIAMVGFSISGVMLSLFKDWAARRAEQLLYWSPVLMMIFAAFGFYFVTINRFNPLELQNPLLWFHQLMLIGQYYLVLFPFFFLAGGYIGMSFLAFQNEIPKVYGVDLVGAGVGALFVLALMFFVHPFYLLATLIPLLGIVSFIWLPAHFAARGRIRAFVVIIFVLCEICVIKFNKADFNEFKSIYPVLNVEGNQVLYKKKSPKGYFMVLDNFTERLDIDLSNNAGLGPPSTYGLYKDGNRVTSLLKERDYDLDYIRGSLDAAPYQLVKAPSVLLLGTRGGFRMPEAMKLGAAHVLALEPDHVIWQLVKHGVNNSGGFKLDDSKIELREVSPSEIIMDHKHKFDVIDIASDFLDQSYANKFVFTREGVRSCFESLTEQGIVSIPVSIREFTVYAVKMIETTRQALIKAGVANPDQHMVVYRSAWNARILVSKEPFTPEQISRLKEFCSKLSFDLSFYAGIDPAKAEIFNDLPLTSFDQSEQQPYSEHATDALMELSLQLFRADAPAFLKNHFFNLSPSTHDRPFFYYILRISKLEKILDNISLIPREEIGYLVNIAVLIQAVLLAIVVLFLPLLRHRKNLPRAGTICKSVVYFAGLGLGFLFLEIVIIDKTAFFLNDSTSAFAVILTGMLVFSGLGSYFAGSHLADPRRAIKMAVLVILIWTALAFFFLDSFLIALLGLPYVIKCFIAILIVAPLSIALGFPFPLGLYLFRGARSSFLPWAWSLNGAFSVLSTPIANLLSVSLGYKIVLVMSALLYFAVWASYPVSRGEKELK